MRLRIALVSLAVFALAAGIAYAAIPDAGTGEFHACMLKNVGTIRIIDPATQHCSATLETAISFGAKGDPGPVGATGAGGANGRNGANGISPTVAQLPVGDANCGGLGGVAITDAAGTTAYACSGAKGADGQPFSGTFTSPNGQYSMNVTDTGISIASTSGTHVTLTGNNVVVQSTGSASFGSEGPMLVRSDSATNVVGDGVLTLRGGTVELNGSAADCSPLVRVGDITSGFDEPRFPGELLQPILTTVGPGATTVCAGG